MDGWRHVCSRLHILEVVLKNLGGQRKVPNYLSAIEKHSSERLATALCNQTQAYAAATPCVPVSSQLPRKKVKPSLGTTSQPHFHGFGEKVACAIRLENR